MSLKTKFFCTEMLLRTKIFANDGTGTRNPLSARAIELNSSKLLPGRS